MRRYSAAVLALLLVVAGLAAVPVAGHGNHLTADAQVVEDHVVVERSFLLKDGYAVVHLDQGGSMGRVLGHTEVQSGPSENFEIDVDEAFLSQIDGSAKVWVVLHRSDGNGEFEANKDTPITGVQGRAAGSIIPVYVSSDGNVNVVARDFGDQRVDESRVTIRRVETNASGFVVVEDSNGSVVGTTPVDAGVQENVTVDVEASYFESLEPNETAELTATVHHDDGDGEFDADADRPVMVRDSRVGSEFSIKKVANASRTTSIVVTAEETTTAATTGDDATTASASSATTDDDQRGGPSPGFGIPVAVLTVLAVLATIAVRRRN